MGNFFKKTLPYVGMAVVIIVVGYFARQNQNYFEKSIVDQARRQLVETVRFEARSLNQHVLNLTQELEILSENQTVQEALSNNSRPSEAVMGLLDGSYKDVKTLAESLSLIDARGVVIYEIPSGKNQGKDLSSEVDVHKLLTEHRMQASGIIEVAKGERVLTFDQPVFKGGKLVGLLRVVINLATLQALVNRDEWGGAYSFLLNQEGRVLSYPERHFLGKSIAALFDENHLSLENSGFKPMMEKMRRGEAGSGICRMFPLDSPLEAEEVIVAFAPVNFDGHIWALVTGIDYDSVSGPVNKNARGNIIFTGFVLLVLSLSAVVFYRDQKRKNYELKRLYGNLERNLEELKATQSLLIQSAKMEVVGKMAAGVAHEVKNPLAIILMNMEFLKNNFQPRDEEMANCFNDIDKAVNRADTIVKGLLDFSSTSGREIMTWDIHNLIERSLSLVKHIRERNSVRLHKEFGEGIPEVSVDGNKIEQVFVNLLMNAIQAMPDGGELRVATSREKAEDGKYWVVVRIEDSGAGIPGSVLKDLFIPFVTTKRASGGTGLGLSIVKHIMDMHGGKIALENKAEGLGARATLWFKI